MTSAFSETDRKLLEYLKAKSRFTQDDSIMAGRRKSLTDSWGVLGTDEDDVSDHSGRSVDISDAEDEPLEPVDEVKKEDDPDAEIETPKTPESKARRSGHISRQLDEPGSETKPSPPSSGRRRSARTQSRHGSVEPQFIMPSMYSSGASLSRNSPQSKSVRPRKVKSLAGSRLSPGQPPRNSPKPHSPKQAKRAKPVQQQISIFTLAWTSLIAPAISYVLGVVGYAMGHLKPVLGLFVAVLTLIWGVKFALQNTIGALTLFPSVSNILPSPCSFPVVNLLPMCGSKYSPGATAEFEELVKVQSSFEDVLQSTAQGSILPLEMKRSEASIRDLKIVVTHSYLPSRGELVHEFQGFIDVAKIASADLTKFNSRVGRAVDQIISTNKHTLQVIDGFVDTESSRGAISRWLWGSSGLTNDHLLRQYLYHTSRVEEEIQRLILEAQVLLKILEDLDGRLDIIYDIVARDGVHIKDSRDELFAQLWTKLGGNRNSVQKLDEQMRLLKSVHTYRKMAWTHVTATLLKLQAISAGLEDLRERVALPEIVGTSDTVSLQQHIETIQMGVDRLERVRESSRGLEMDGQRRALEQGVGKDRQIE